MFGAAIGGFFALGRHGIARFMVPGEADSVVRGLLADTLVPCGVFSCLFSIQWGLWSVLEGQGRVCITSVCLSAGTWGVAVPLAYFSLHFYSDANSCDVNSLELLLVWWS